LANLGTDPELNSRRRHAGRKITLATTSAARAKTASAGPHRVAQRGALAKRWRRFRTYPEKKVQGSHSKAASRPAPWNEQNVGQKSIDGGGGPTISCCLVHAAKAAVAASTHGSSPRESRHPQAKKTLRPRSATGPEHARQVALRSRTEDLPVLSDCQSSQNFRLQIRPLCPSRGACSPPQGSKKLTEHLQLVGGPWAVGICQTSITSCALNICRL